MKPQQQDFFKDVWEVARLVPKGRVTSYGAIAKYLGMPRSARVVGWAMNNCHGLQPPVPAHRIVNRLGLLSGKAHFADPNLMQILLEEEGVRVQENQVQNFEEIFWDPTIALEL